MSADLRVALDPRSIAIIGASENPDKIGGRPVHYLARFGFRGAVYPINPNRREIQGLASFPDLAALPDTPDVVVIAVPGEAAVAAVDQCALAGVKLAIMMASGFGETEGGKTAEREMVARARAHGMRLVGPNSQGLANFATGAVASFSSMFAEVPPQDGPVAIISQSGAMGVVPYGVLRGRGIGIRHAHATGNDGDVSAPELAIAVAQDSHVQVLLLYLESITGPQNLAEVARVAHARNLPVLALKSGRTPAGQVAAQSHTGALANEDRLVDAFLQRLGIRRVRDMAEMIDAVELYLKGWRPAGRRLVVISNSGATCVMAADAASAAGMPLARLSEPTQAGLRAVLPSFAATANPIDTTAALLTNNRLFSEILPVLARDPAADAFMIGLPVAGAAYDVPMFARDTQAFAELTGKPLVVAAPQQNVAAPFKAAGLPVYMFETQAIAALNGFLQHSALIARVRDRPLHPVVPLAQPADGHPLNEAQSLHRLAEAGIPVIAHRLCRTPAEAVQALAALGGRVVLKGCSADVMHKSEHGLVRLDLTDAVAVQTAFAECEHTLREAGLRFDGVLVAPMQRGRREMLIGAHRDPIFGPVVLLGDGGKYVEVLQDTTLLIPPFTEGDVLSALEGLRIAPLLRGVRGERPMDVSTFAAAAVAVGALMLDEPDIVSLDINPLLIGDDTQPTIALDAVVVSCGRTM